MNVEVKRINSDLVDDFLYFFDNIAFEDNPDWKCCYCYFFHSDCSTEDWMKRTCKENREASKQLILSNRMNGLMAFVDNKPVGWCHSDKKSSLVGLKHHLNIVIDSNEKVGAIVCFIVAPKFRRKGIARKLLSHSCEEFKNQNYSYIEAYPKKECASNSGNYHGPLSMYLSDGFVVYKEFSNYVIVRKEI